MKTHTSKRTPEKATVNEPHSRPKCWHQSGTHTPFGSRRTVSRICLLEQVLNNSKVKGNHFMHICIHSKRACQTYWLSSRSSPLMLFTAIVQIVKGNSLLLNDFFSWRWFTYMKLLSDGYKQQGTTATHGNLGGPWKVAGKNPRKRWRPAVRGWKTVAAHKTSKLQQQIKNYSMQKKKLKASCWHWLHASLLWPTA